MQYSQIVQDINIAVRQALAENLYQLSEDQLIQHADDLLKRLPIVGDVEPTTELLMNHYHTELHAELCENHQPRVRLETVEDELRELTRAVMATMGSDEGLSIETAVMLGLVLYKHGLAKFCAYPSTIADLA